MTDKYTFWGDLLRWWKYRDNPAAANAADRADIHKWEQNQRSKAKNLTKVLAGNSQLEMSELQLLGACNFPFNVDDDPSQSQATSDTSTREDIGAMNADVQDNIATWNRNLADWVQKRSENAPKAKTLLDWKVVQVTEAQKYEKWQSSQLSRKQYDLLVKFDFSFDNVVVVESSDEDEDNERHLNNTKPSATTANVARHARNYSEEQNPFSFGQPRAPQQMPDTTTSAAHSKRHHSQVAKEKARPDSSSTTTSSNSTAAHSSVSWKRRKSHIPSEFGKATGRAAPDAKEGRNMPSFLLKKQPNTGRFGQDSDTEISRVSNVDDNRKFAASNTIQANPRAGAGRTNGRVPRDTSSLKPPPSSTLLPAVPPSGNAPRSGSTMEQGLHHQPLEPSQNNPIHQWQSRPLSLASDNGNINDLHCFFRQQIDLIVLQKERPKRSHYRYAVGQVGIRCRHCRNHFQFPRSFNSMPKGVHNMVAQHFESAGACPAFSVQDRERMHEKQEKYKPGRQIFPLSQRQYYEQTLGALGIVEDTRDGVEGLFLRRDSGGRDYV